MKKIYFVLFFIFILTFTLMGIDCPSCNSNMIWTGQSKIEWGGIVKLYKCPFGHQYWITTQQEQEDNFNKWNNKGNKSNEQSYSSPFISYGVQCPICRGSMYFTGRTKIEWGKLLKGTSKNSF